MRITWVTAACWSGLVAVVGGAWGGETLVVSGRVVDEQDRPVVRAVVATHWDAFDGSRMRAFHPSLTDQDGQFSLKVEFWQEYLPLLAMNSEQTRGGTIILGPRSSRSNVVFKLEPLARVHGRFTCNALGEPPFWSNVYMNLMPGKLPVPGFLTQFAPTPLRLAQCSTWDATFSLMLPPGHYQFNGYSSFSDYNQAYKLLELKAAEPDCDLGAIDLQPTPLAHRYGKPAPELHVTDALGIGKGVKLADFRGKWVLLEFWATWCGPCVSVGLPTLMDFDRGMKEHRDRYVILTFHETSARNLAELEPRLVQASQAHWGGKRLPFPILLDSTGQTLKNYSVHAYPSAYLIDPEGRLVQARGRAEELLRDKLVPPDPAQKISRLLDEPLEFGIDGMPLDLALYYLIDFFGSTHHESIFEMLEATGVDPGEPIPLALTARISRRSWLELFIAPFGLTYKIQNSRIVLKRREPDAPPSAPWSSAVQQEAARRLEGLLDKRLDFDFKDTSLANLVEALSKRTGEPFALDPVARRAAQIDPEAKVTGTDDEETLRTALERLLRPLEMHLTIRDEVVLLTR